MSRSNIHHLSPSLHRPSSIPVVKLELVTQSVAGSRLFLTTFLLFDWTVGSLVILFRSSAVLLGLPIDLLRLFALAASSFGPLLWRRLDRSLLLVIFWSGCQRQCCSVS